MHICIVTGEFPALTETFVTTKALELAKRGHRITVVKNENSKYYNSTHLPAVLTAHIQILSGIFSASQIFSQFIVNPSNLFLLFNYKELKNKIKAQLQRRLLSKNKFDIIHFEFSGLALSYLDVIDKLGAPTVVSCRGTAEKVKPLSVAGRGEKLTALFSKVQAIHCVSDDMAKSIQPYCSQPQKIFVNRPSIDAEIFKRTKQYPENDVLQILSIGRFTFQKGYLLGLLAIKELKENGIKFLWKIIGNGPQFEEMQYHIHTLGLTGFVELAGKRNRDEIIEIYNTADIFFLPSVYEGIANVSLEAMAMELPVVATTSGGMEEVIEHGLDGLLAATYDHHAMAKQLLLLANDFDKRKMLGANARRKVEEQFTLSRQADVFEERYYELVKQQQ